jgi:hypothetical protein
MNSDFCSNLNTKNSPEHQGLLNRLFPEEEWDVRRFWRVTVLSLGLGMATGIVTGTALAITLDLPPVLGICQALHSLKK